MKRDVYHKVTGKIFADLEKGKLSWLKVWSAGDIEGRIGKPLRHNGMHYNGINALMLYAAALEGGYPLRFLMIFNHAKEFGAQVQKGARGLVLAHRRASA